MLPGLTSALALLRPGGYCWLTAVSGPLTGLSLRIEPKGLALRRLQQVMGEAWKDGGMDGYVSGWVGRWMGEWEGGWVDGWVTGWMDGRVDTWLDM